MMRDQQPNAPELKIMIKALDTGEEIYSTGVILQELLQGFTGAKAADAIVERFSSIPMLVPETSDQIQAAEIRNKCRRKGVQIGTIDALIAQLSIRYKLSLLTADRDFKHMSTAFKPVFAK
jgi:predicted nucleic acid-binding protein